MRQTILLLTILCSVSVFANETHTPQFKCAKTSGFETIHILVGNSFSQNDLDWSDEVQLASQEEYLDKDISEEMKFEFSQKWHDGFATLTNEAGKRLLYLNNQLYIFEDYKILKTYNCSKQRGA